MPFVDSVDFSLVTDDTDPPVVPADVIEVVLVDVNDSDLVVGTVAGFGESSFNFLKSLGFTLARYFARESFELSVVSFLDNSSAGGGGTRFIAGVGVAVFGVGGITSDDCGGCTVVILSSSITSLRS